MLYMCISICIWSSGELPCRATGLITFAALEDFGSSSSRHILGWHLSHQVLFSATCSSIIPNFSAMFSSSCDLSDSSSLLWSSMQQRDRWIKRLVNTTNAFYTVRTLKYNIKTTFCIVQNWSERPRISKNTFYQRDTRHKME